MKTLRILLIIFISIVTTLIVLYVTALGNDKYFGQTGYCESTLIEYFNEIRLINNLLCVFYSILILDHVLWKEAKVTIVRFYLMNIAVVVIGFNLYLYAKYPFVDRQYGIYSDTYVANGLINPLFTVIIIQTLLLYYHVYVNIRRKLLPNYLHVPFIIFSTLALGYSLFIYFTSTYIVCKG